MKKTIIILISLMSLNVFGQWQSVVPDEYESFLALICELNSVPVEIVAAIGEVESNWRLDPPAARNWNTSHDIGVFQLNSKYVAYYEEKFWESSYRFNPQNPRHNIEVAVRYLSWLYKQTADWTKAVAAYNVGLTALRNNSKPETARAYIIKVISVMEEMNSSD